MGGRKAKQESHERHVLNTMIAISLLNIIYSYFHIHLVLATNASTRCKQPSGGSFLPRIDSLL